MPYLAFRFDIDSVRCVEEGVPRLLRVAERYGIPFTFFVNMGRSCNRALNLRRALRSAFRRRAPAVRAAALPLLAKHGWRGLADTLLFNPRLGPLARRSLESALAAGHELGLHGGSDHCVWQHRLDCLAPDELAALFEPAYREYVSAFGTPEGFASPGFATNGDVLSLLREYRFRYASDAVGEEPFPAGAGTGNGDLYQVPVNVVGPDTVPIIEHLIAKGLGEKEICDYVVQRIRRRSFAMVYGHPFVEGVRWEILERIIAAVGADYRIVTVGEYFARWKALRHRGTPH